ncbi:MAG: CPBP family intramembrane metalloprotease [Proteobacteria bacterium]|nr:CPBP family intramembrane metalloprotease [Pseudomonadota bacterium]
MWLLFTVQTSALSVDEGPLVWLQYPEHSAARVTDRHLALAEAGEASAFRPFWRLYHGSLREHVGFAVDVHQELLDEIEADGLGAEWEAWVRLRLASLLAEAGRLDEAVAVARPTEFAPFLESVLRAAYEAESPAAPGLARATAGWWSEDWLGPRVLERLARAEGETDLADDYRASRLELGRRLLGYGAGLLALEAVLVAAGVAAGLVWWRRRRNPAPRLPAPPWHPRVGIGVLLVGDTVGRACFFWLFALLASEWWAEGLYASGSLISALPLVVFAWWMLPARSWRLGLGWSERRVPLWLAAFAVASALDLVMTQAIGWAAFSLDWADHWSEGLDETLVWGPASELWPAVLDFVAWAPLFEEIAFRGILYWTLRQRLPVWGAATVSAAVFSVLHFYGLPGFLMTFWSGLVWALVFEHVRSLWPGIAAHALYNALYVASVMALYR